MELDVYMYRQCKCKGCEYSKRSFTVLFKRYKCYFTRMTSNPVQLDKNGRCMSKSNGG